MRIVVGLGNPGARYARTRHNIGFMVADRLADQSGVKWSRRDEVCCETAEVQIGGVQTLLVKPQTYMNRCGRALAALQQELEFDPAEVLVMLDDFQLEFGRLRLRRGGSDGGHNGLASVCRELRTSEVPRLRLGIGAAPVSAAVIEYVLDPFDAAENVPGLVVRGEEAVALCLREGIEAAMNLYNGLQGL